MLPWLSWAQDAEVRSVALAELLEEGIYLQEAKGDLDGAVAIFENLLARSEVGRGRAAEAQYRLAVCYLEKGEKLAAVEAFEKLVELYPDQKRWVEAALEYLPEEFEPELIPWSPGERTVLKWRLPTGVPIGQMIYTVEEIKREGADFWKFSGQGYISQRLHTITEVEKSTLRPYRSRFFQTLSGLFQSQYKDGEIATVDMRKGVDESVAIEGRVYDYLQSLFMVRQISLEAGRTIELSVFSPTEGKAHRVPFEVLGTEALDTEIGEFEALKIKSKYSGIDALYWISNDERRRILKIAMGGIEGDIVRFDKIKFGDYRTHRNEKYGYSIEYPDSWGLMESFVLQKNDVDRIFFLDPNTPDESYLYLRSLDTHNFEEELSPDPLVAIDQIANFILSSYRRKFPDLELLGDGFESLVIDGHPARLFIAKGDLNGESVNFMRGVMARKDMLFHFSCRKREVDFDQSVDVYRHIFSSIRFKHDDRAADKER